MSEKHCPLWIKPGEAESVAGFRAEIRTERDPSGKYVSYLTFIYGDKAHPYLHIPETLEEEVLKEAMKRLNTPASLTTQGKKWRVMPSTLTRSMIDAAEAVEEDGFEAMYQAMIRNRPRDKT